MKIKWVIAVFLHLILFAGCNKDESVISVYSGTTRIDYAVNNPLEMPHLEFTLYNLNDLTNNTFVNIELIANESSNSLYLMIMLEDEQGHQTDIDPMVISEEEFFKDNIRHNYSFDLTQHLASTTSSSDEVDLSRISKVLIFINSGIAGKVAEGSFWLDKIEFRMP